MSLEKKLQMGWLKLSSQEDCFQASYFSPLRNEEILGGDNPDLLQTYRNSSHKSSYLGKWTITGQREVRVFLSPLGDVEAFLCEEGTLSCGEKLLKQIKIVQRLAPDRIKGGLNGSISLPELTTLLKKSPEVLQAALHRPYFLKTPEASPYTLYFLPRLHAAAGTVKERESLLRKLTSLQKSLQGKDCNQELALDEFSWALDIASKCDKDLLPVEEILLCADSLAKLVLKDSDLVKEESLYKVYEIYYKAYSLLKAKELLSSHRESLLASLAYWRRNFLTMTYLKSFLASPGSNVLLHKEENQTEKEAHFEESSWKLPFQEWDKYLLLSMQVCLQDLDSQEVARKLLQLFQEGRQVYLHRAIREKQFPFYQEASHYAVLAYHLSNRYDSSSSLEALQELLAVQGAYLKEHLGDCKGVIDYYKNKKGNLLNWKKLSQQGQEELLIEVERIADFFLTRRLYTPAYAFYRLGSDLQDRFSSEDPQESSQSISNATSIQASSSGLSRTLHGIEGSLERGSFTPRRFSLAATDAFENLIPQDLLKKEELFRKKLKGIREKSAALIQDHTSLSQKEQKEGTFFYCDLIKEIFQECVWVLSTEKTPDYALVGIGSLSRGEMCPFSDIELALITEEFSLKSSLKELAKDAPRLTELIEKIDLVAQKEQLDFEQALQKHIQKEKQCRQTIETLLKRSTEEQIRLEELVQEEVMRQKSPGNLAVTHSTFVEEMELFEKREKKIPLERFLNWKKDQIDELTTKLSPESLEDLKKASKHMEAELFYSQLSELFNLSIIALGESPGGPDLSVSLVSAGFHLDKDNNPLELRATAREFALRQTQVEEVKSIQNNALRTTLFIAGNPNLHAEYQESLKQTLNQGNLRSQHAEANVRAYRSKSFESLESEDYLDVKQDLLRLPVFFFETLCLYHGLETKNFLSKERGSFSHTLDKIELLCEKGFFPACLQKPFQEFLELGFYLRFKVHLESGKENDNYLPSSLEKKKILHLHKLLIEPLKALLDAWGESLDKGGNINLTSHTSFLFAKAYYNRAKVLMERNQPAEEVLAHLEKALLIQERPEIFFLLGKVYFAQNDFSKAYEVWQKITALEGSTSVERNPAITEEEMLYLQKENLQELLHFVQEQAKTDCLLEQAFHSLNQSLKEKTEERENEETRLSSSFETNPPSFPERLSPLLKAEKMPLLQQRLKNWVSLLLEQELQKDAAQAKKSVVEKMQPLYFELPKAYQKELKELLQTTFSDKLFLWEQFLTEEGYPFAAMVKKQRWLQGLSRWRKEKLASGETPLPLIEGITIEKGYLLSSVARALFEGKEFKNEIQWGNRAVTQAVGTHFKKNPESPGDEYAVFLLNHLITGQGSPPVEIMKVVVSKEEHLLLASETVQVEPLHLFFSTYGDCLGRVNKKQFSQMVLMALLTDPEDGKADNYIASYSRDAKGEIQDIQIIGVDNDHVFVKPFVQKGLIGQEQLFIKTILFCFDQMQEEFHPEVREEFLRLDPSRVLENWLEGLILYNKRVERLFSEDTLDAFWKNGILIPFFMHPDQLLYLHEKMLRIQHFFSKGIKTHLELLKHLDARVGGLYETALLQSLSPKKRFEMLTKDAYQRKAHASFTLTTTAQIKKHTLKSNLDKITHFKSQSFTPEEGLKSLKILIDARRHKESAQKQMDTSWEAMDFRRLLTVPLQEKMLREKDWSEVPISNLTKLEKIPFRKMYLRNYKALKDQDLERFLKACLHPVTENVEVQTLDLRGCENLTSKSIAIISNNCPRLQKLNLESTLIKEASFSLKKTPYLRFLSLKNCTLLRSLTVTQNNLKVLILEGCSGIKTLTLDCPELLSFQIKRCSPAASSFSEQTPISQDLFKLLVEFSENEGIPFSELSQKVITNPKTLKIFAEVLHTNHRFKTLKMSLSKDANLLFALFESLKLQEHSTFPYLEIEGVKEEYLIILAQFFSNLSPLLEVHLTNLEIGEDRSFVKIFSKASFGKLVLTGTIANNKEVALAWSQNKNLLKIDLRGAALDSEMDIFLLANSPTLEELYLPLGFYEDTASRKRPLHSAAAAGNKKLCGFFLSQGLDVNARDISGKTALQIAIARQDNALISFLIGEGGLGWEYKLARWNYPQVLEKIVGNDLEYASILDVSFLKAEDASLFFHALEYNRSLFVLRFSEEDEFFSKQANKIPGEGGKIDKWSPWNIPNLKEWLASLLTKNPVLKTLDLEKCPSLTGEDIKGFLHGNDSTGIRIAPSLASYRDPDNRTFLHLAVLAKNINAVKSFIAQGIPLSIKDNQEQTAFDLALNLGCREIVILLGAFGKSDWERYFGYVGEESPLPSDIHEILRRPCPIWPGKKVADTHLLTLIPQSVNGKPLTLDYLGDLIQSPKGGGNDTKYNYDIHLKDDLRTKPIDRPYWILLSKDILPNTREKSYQAQCQELERLKGRSARFKEGDYRVPKALEAATSILMEYVRSGNRLYSNTPTDGTGYWTYTRCLEISTWDYQVLIGGLAASGLDVRLDDGLGVGGLCGLGVVREV